MNPVRLFVVSSTDINVNEACDSVRAWVRPGRHVPGDFLSSTVHVLASWTHGFSSNVMRGGLTRALAAEEPEQGKKKSKETDEGGLVLIGMTK